MARTEMTRLRATLTHVFLIIFGITMILPFLWMLSTSLKSEVEVFQDHILPREVNLGVDGQELQTVDGVPLYHAVIARDAYGQNRTETVIEDGEEVERLVYERGDPVRLRVGNPMLQGSPGDRARTNDGVNLSDDLGLPIYNRDIGWGSGHTRFRDPRKFARWAEPVLIDPDFFGDQRDADNQALAKLFFSRYQDNWDEMVRQRWSGQIPLMLTLTLRDAWEDKAGQSAPVSIDGRQIEDRQQSALVNARRAEQGLEPIQMFYQYRDLSWPSSEIESNPRPVRFQRRPAKVVTAAGLPIDFEPPFPIYRSDDDPLMANSRDPLMVFLGDAELATTVPGRALETHSRFRLQWANFETVLMDPDVKMSLFAWNSFFIAVCVVFLQLTTSSLAAFAFARLEWPGRDKVFFAYLATLMIPGIVTSIPNFLILQRLGWLDTFYALIVPASATAYGTFMLRQYMLTLPRGLEEAALIDGASLLRVWWDIVVPLCKPALITLAIFTFAGTWQSFTWPLIVTTSEEVRVLPVALKNFSDNQSTVYNLLMAASLVMMIPMLLLFIFGQKYFVRGIQLGGIKG